MTIPATPQSPEKTYKILSKPDKIHPVIQELQAYLKTKLQYIEVPGGDNYYSCGHDYHYPSDPHWKPFKHFDNFCIETDLQYNCYWNLLFNTTDYKLLDIQF